MAKFIDLIQTKVCIVSSKKLNITIQRWSSINIAINFSALMGSATSNGFQLVVGGSQSKALNDFEIVNIQVS